MFSLVFDIFTMIILFYQTLQHHRLEPTSILVRFRDDFQVFGNNLLLPISDLP